MMTLQLLSIPFSHYCEKARWALERAGLPYTEKGHLPVFHYLYNRRAGAGATVPALITPEGVLKDSSDILIYAHAQGADLYPAAHMAEIRSLEARADRIGKHARAWAYSHLLTDFALLAEVIQHADPREQKLARPFFGLLAKGLGKKYRVRPGHSQKHRTEINTLWDQFDFLLRDGRSFLVGERFSAADLSLAALGGVLVMPPEYGYAYPPLERYPEAMRADITAWRERPTGQHILKLYTHHRHPSRA